MRVTHAMVWDKLQTKAHYFRRASFFILIMAKIMKMECFSGKWLKEIAMKRSTHCVDVVTGEGH